MRVMLVTPRMLDVYNFKAQASGLRRPHGLIVTRWIGPSHGTEMDVNLRRVWIKQADWQDGDAKLNVYKSTPWLSFSAVSVLWSTQPSSAWELWLWLFSVLCRMILPQHSTRNLFIYFKNHPKPDCHLMEGRSIHFRKVRCKSLVLYICISIAEPWHAWQARQQVRNRLVKSHRKSVVFTQARIRIIICTDIQRYSFPANCQWTHQSYHRDHTYIGLSGEHHLAGSAEMDCACSQYHWRNAV